MIETVVIHTTANGINVYARPGGKEKWDFIVSHDRADNTIHQVFHRDFICDFYRKRQVAPRASRALVDHLIGIINRARGVSSFPPSLVHFSQEHVEKLFQEGVPSTEGFDLELLLVLFELVQIQEETNYPGGWVPRKLYGMLRENPDDLEGIAYQTEVVVPYRENRRSLRRKDELLAELRCIEGV